MNVDLKVIDRENYQKYIDLFNGFDPAFTQFYHDDVVLTIDRPVHDDVVLTIDRPIKTPQGILEFYRQLRNNIDEKIQVDFYVSDANGAAALLTGEFHCFRDLDSPDLFGRPIKRGEVRRQRGVVLYGVENGKFKWIKAMSSEVLNDWRQEGSGSPLLAAGQFIEDLNLAQKCADCAHLLDHDEDYDVPGILSGTLVIRGS